MNPVTKFEVVGIFMSVAIMAVALSYIRFNTNAFALNQTKDAPTQAALVVSTENSKDTTALETALRDSGTIDGKLTRLIIDDVRVGTGEAVAKGDSVVVHYVGTTQDGVKFDSSYERGEPFTFTVGGGTVIKGWDEGLIGMKVGGQRVLVIPPDMAYGNRQVGPIPPNSVLVFAVELLEIK